MEIADLKAWSTIISVLTGLVVIGKIIYSIGACYKMTEQNTNDIQGIDKDVEALKERVSDISKSINIDITTLGLTLRKEILISRQLGVSREVAAEIEVQIKSIDHMISRAQSKR